MFEYKTKGVCSSKIEYVIENDIIKYVKIIGGCPGNSSGVCKLCLNRNIDEVITLLENIDCRGRGTSCPDQLAKGLIEYKTKKDTL